MSIQVISYKTTSLYKAAESFITLSPEVLLERYSKNEILLKSLIQINQHAQAGIFADHRNYCLECKCYRFDPLLTRKEAGAYLNFSPDTLMVYDSTRRYDFQPVKYNHAIRYHLSSLNNFADQRIRP